VPIEIRPASDADESVITQIRRETWFAAYAQIIDPTIIDRLTAPHPAPTATPAPHRTSLVAIAPAIPPATPAAAVTSIVSSGAPAVIGYASFGPERAVVPAFAAPEAHPATPPPDPAAAPPQPATGPAPFTAAGLAGETGELYALYVTPDHWSTGAGRALTDAVLDGLRAAGYRRVVLWTLTENARARRFYAKAGFAPDGATNVLAALGHIEEVRYARDL
jgi:ribosomal protein S18 acetylase RimI-like enzyme